MDVAVLGLGTMGAGMAANLVKAGHAVRVWNRTPGKAEALVAAGAFEASTPGEAVRGAEVVVTMLFDLDSTRQVIRDAATDLAPGTVWLQTATVGLDGSAELAELAAELDLALLDAPVLGTKKPAEDGTLTVLASGDPTLRARVEPVLEAISSKTVWAGDTAGAGSALKLAANAWVFTLTAATAQSLALAGSLGLDPELFLAAIDGSPTGSPYAQVKGRAMLAGSYAPSFQLDGALKDLGLIVTATESAGVDPGVIRAVRAAFTSAQQAGHGADDFAAVYEALVPPAA